MTKDEALKMALEALEIGYDAVYAEAQQYHRAMHGYRPDTHKRMDDDVKKIAKTITAIKEALEGQPEQEPDAPDIVVVDESNSQTNTMSWAINLPLPIGTPLYTSPPAKPWVGLTDEEFSKAAFDAEFHKWFGYDWEKEGHLFFFKKFVEAIEAKLKEKNGL